MKAPVKSVEAKRSPPTPSQLSKVEPSLLSMFPETPTETVPAVANFFAASDIAAILRERGWLDATSAVDAGAELDGWLARAAELLGPHARDRTALAGLLELIFSYDASALLRGRESHAVLVRTGAREVIRELASCVLDAGKIDSDRFKEIVDAIKAALPYRSRALFHPIRLALAGRAGEGELDRVILLVDSAAKLHFAAPVKNVRQRMLEFCAALD
jgi:Anticodon binding domain